MPLSKFFIPILIFFFISCAKDKPIYEPKLKTDPYKIYSEAIEAFKKNDFFYASQKFGEAEINFEKPKLVAKSALMRSFSLYAINFYSEALESISNFINKYPGDENVIYAHYLTAIIYFEQIEDEKKDIGPLIKAEEQINFFLNKYPNTEYAFDLKFKKDLIQNQLAAKELYIAKFYIKTKKWAAAIKRLKVIINKYDKTIFIEEALFRLIEVYYYLGVEEEAKKYLSILGYNYNSSEWYELSYKILNKNYEIIEVNSDKKIEKSFIKKIIEHIK